MTPAGNDAWLARLPTTRSSLPELDVHPRALTVRAKPGEGRVRRTLRISNVGHRLLTGNVRVEPPGTPWIRLVADGPVLPFAVAEVCRLTLMCAPAPQGPDIHPNDAGYRELYDAFRKALRL